MHTVDNMLKHTTAKSCDYFWAPSAPVLAELADAGSVDGAEPPQRLDSGGVTVRDHRRRQRYFAPCENCAEPEAPHTGEEGAEVGLCLLCHRLQPRLRAPPAASM